MPLFFSQQPQLPDIFKTEVFQSISSKTIAFLSNGSFIQLFNKIVESIDLEKLLIGEGIVFLLMLVTRSYMFSRTRGFLSQLWAEVWTLTVFFSLAFFFIPLFVIGWEFLEIIKIAIKMIHA